MSHILITGATGLVGRALSASLLEKGHTLHVVTRSGEKATKTFGTSVNPICWNAREPLPPVSSQVEFVVNLMGENIGEGRWNKAKKRRIEESRIGGTAHLVEGLKTQGLNLKAFVSASAIGFYPVNTGGPLDEESPPGSDSFLSALCQGWEEKAKDAVAQRTVILRIGVVLGKGGGALKKLLPLFSLGLGGRAGSGKQMMSWIHLDDLVSIFEAALFDARLEGPVNATAPGPVTNGEFSRSLAKALARPCLFPAPGPLLKLALGEMSCLVLDSQEIYPRKLEAIEFPFRFGHIHEALEDIVS